VCITIPSALPSKASRGEALLWNTLKDRLSDDFILYYEPEIVSLNPDFILVGKDFGVLILEVKGWTRGMIEAADRNFFTIRQRDDRTERQQSPLRQATGYRNALLDAVKKFDVLTHSSGTYQGKPLFPIGVAAVMSNITYAQAQEIHIDGVLERERLVYRDELLDMAAMSDRELIPFLQRLCAVQFSMSSLTDDQMNTIRGILHPEVVIKRAPASMNSITAEQLLLPDSEILLCLDVEQERTARQLGNGHRILAGVAGSGKTCILLSRAKILANQPGQSRILVLCMNISLAGYLRSVLHGDQQNPQYEEKITVKHFNAWAKLVLGRLPNPQMCREKCWNYEEHLSELLLQELESWDDAERYDAILIDEAHTFDMNWFGCCVAALKDPENGDLLITTDGNQRLYQRKAFTWKAVGIKAVGRTRLFTQNYRNTAEILTAAWSIVQTTIVDGDEKEDLTFPIIAPSAALRFGSKPRLIPCKNGMEQVESVVEQARQLLAQGYVPGEIAIIYKQLSGQDRPAFEHLLAQFKAQNMATYWITENDLSKNYDRRRPGIRITTALSSLGLEFKIVMILWLDQFEVYGGDGAMERRKLYVAMTRSQEQLYLYGYGYSRLVNEMRGSEFFLVEQPEPVLSR
jgi:Nuclease-related domain/UvrD-like helicase C-terminal domain